MLQYSIMGDMLINLGFASVTSNYDDKSYFWNHGLTNKVLSKEEIAQIAKTLTKLKRKPAVYFENSFSLTNNKKTLTELGYKKTWKDSWLFHLGKNIYTNKFKAIKKVVSEKDLEVFLETFNNCYQKDDPQNPYGELGDYLKVAKKSWLRHNQSGRMEYFLVMDKGKPVAVSTLTNFAGIGYISNVGSLRAVRGQGFGKIASLFCVYKSVKNANYVHCLATEEGNYPHEFYQRIGFKLKFSALGYLKA